MDYLLLILQSVLSVFGIRGLYEQPKYDVVARLTGGVEVRQYAPRLAAETTVSAGDEAAGRDEAFRLLAGYIFGANTPADGRTAGGAGEKVAMTAPVEVKRGGGETVAMTTPVQVDRADGAGGYTMRFFLPSKLTADTAPEPRDARVRIVTVPGETVAVLRFGGSWDARNIGAKKQALLRSLEGSGWRAAGEPDTLYYDPPFTIPVLRRNEVVTPVEPRAE